MRKRQIALAIVLLAAEGCLDLTPDPENENGCTQIGCSDGVSIVLHKASPWMDGAYVFRFEADGHGTNCTASFPQDLPLEQQTKLLECDPVHEVTLSNEVACMDERSRDVSSQVCGTLTDRWMLQTGTASTPRKVSVSVTRDGERLLSKSVEMKYELVFPNGPDCGPGCKLGAVDVTMD